MHGLGPLIGLVYGIVAQLFVRLEAVKELYAVMSLGMIFVLPLVLGFLTVWVAEGETRRSWPYRVFMPWLTTGSSLAVSLAVGWEGSICVVMAGVVFLPMSSIGGLCAGLVRQRARTRALGVMLLVPFATAGLESRLPLPEQVTETRTEIAIDAPPSRVWPEITRVRPIVEEQSGFFYKVGFPKPIEATLSHEGVGGVRHASFERGLLFIETITEWVPERRLRFSIDADPSNTPLTTLDPHVTVGGRYFDVLEGTYEIVPRGDASTLVLSSRHRTSTRFNFYAGWLSDLLMRDIQSSILGVIKERAEHASE
jgi:hypothetical protein